jgi:hypothetical protein
MTKKVIFTKYISLTILAMFLIAFFSYNLPEKYQLANLGVGARFIAPNATETNQASGYQGLINLTPTTILGETNQPPNLYTLLNPNQSQKANLQLGGIILTPRNELFVVSDSITSNSIKWHTIKTEDLETNSITSRTIEDKTIQKEDLSPSLKDQIYDTDSDSGGVAEETDPIFIAWNKQTGITIEESQISDLGNYITDGNTNWNNSYGFITNLDSLTTDNLTQGSNNKYSQWTTNGSNLSYTNNIGIGTTAPGNKLHIYTRDATSGIRTSLICSSSTVSKLYTDASGNLICGTDQTGSGTGNLIDSLADTLAAGNDGGGVGIVEVT